jgi:predicted Zn finger-like uncharacterized protein
MGGQCSQVRDANCGEASLGGVMAEEKFTRCPACKTIFRVTSAQLGMRAGQVRCGHCHAVFDGVAQLLSLAPRRAPEEPEFDESTLGPPTVTLRNEHALETVAEEPPAHEERAEPSIDTGTAEAESQDPALAEAAYAARFSWQEKQTRRRVPSWVYSSAVPLLLLVLVGQTMFHYRDAVAAHWPRTKPTLVTLCMAAGCRIGPLVPTQDLPWVEAKNSVVVESSELQADPAHKGLLILSATIHNSVPYALAYPYLELTLSDVQTQTQQDVVVVRRVFSPQDYVLGVTDLDSGIPGNTEFNIRLFIDASATTQAGYQVYVFYP